MKRKDFLHMSTMAAYHFLNKPGNTVKLEDNLHESLFKSLIDSRRPVFIKPRDTTIIGIGNNGVLQAIRDNITFNGAVHTAYDSNHRLTHTFIDEAALYMQQERMFKPAIHAEIDYWGFLNSDPNIKGIVHLKGRRQYLPKITEWTRQYYYNPPQHVLNLILKPSYSFFEKALLSVIYKHENRTIKN